MMSDNFYRAFEDKHRGSRQEIKRRLQIYLPFVLPVVQTHEPTTCLDLGCGRGEWLELMAEQGVQAQGVDLDNGMLQAAQAQGLNVRRVDAIQALQQQPDSSVSVVTAFHLVEHLPFDDLREMVVQALRVLVPGGLLILETPSPDNLRVASCSFYLDPTHIKPLPSELLNFLTQQTGFARSKVMGLQESGELRFKNALQLEDVLWGASPDYAVVAQKAGWTNRSERLSVLFARDYGVTTAQLAQSYSAQQNHALRDIQLQMHDLRVRLQNATAQIYALQQHAQLELDVAAIQQSSLWRFFRPLVWLHAQVRKLRNEGVKSRTDALIRKLRNRWDKPPLAVTLPTPEPDGTLNSQSTTSASHNCEKKPETERQFNGQEYPPH